MADGVEVEEAEEDVEAAVVEELERLGGGWCGPGGVGGGWARLGVELEGAGLGRLGGGGC